MEIQRGGKKNQKATEALQPPWRESEFPTRSRLLGNDTEVFLSSRLNRICDVVSAVGGA